MPKEVADAGAGNWKNVNGTGPFHTRPSTCRATPIPTSRIRFTGARRRSTASSTSSRSSTRSFSAPSRTRRHTSRRCALPSSTCSRTIRWPRVEELKKNAPQLQMVEVAQHAWHVSRDAGRYQTVRRHPRASRAQSRRQQAGNRQGVLRRQRGVVRLSATSRLSSAISNRSRPCRTRSRNCSTYNPDKAKKLLAEAGVAEGIHLQGAGVLVQSPTTWI